MLSFNFIWNGARRLKQNEVTFDTGIFISQKVQKNILVRKQLRFLLLLQWYYLYFCIKIRFAFMTAMNESLKRGDGQTWRWRGRTASKRSRHSPEPGISSAVNDLLTKKQLWRNKIKTQTRPRVRILQREVQFPPPGLCCRSVFLLANRMQLTACLPHTISRDFVATLTNHKVKLLFHHDKRYKYWTTWNTRMFQQTCNVKLAHAELKYYSSFRLKKKTELLKKKNKHSVAEQNLQVTIC